jgi:hypothetical protein
MTHSIGSVVTPSASTNKTAPIIEVKPHLSEDMVWNQVSDCSSRAPIDKPRLNEDFVKQLA